MIVVSASGSEQQLQGHLPSAGALVSSDDAEPACVVDVAVRI